MTQQNPANRQPPFTEDTPILDRFRLDGRTALITGGAQGLWRGFAIALAQAGASVMIADLNGDGAATTAADLSDRGLNVASEPGGLAQPSTFQTRDGIPHAFFRFPDAYRNEIIAFANTVANGTAPTVNHHDALAAFRVAVACQRSATDHRPVELTEMG